MNHFGLVFLCLDFYFAKQLLMFKRWPLLGSDFVILNKQFYDFVVEYLLI